MRKKTRKTVNEVRDPRLAGEVFIFCVCFCTGVITAWGGEEGEEDAREAAAAECHDSDSQFGRARNG